MPTVCFSLYHKNSILFEAYFGKYYASKVVKIDLVKDMNALIEEVRNKVILQSCSNVEDRIIA